MTKKEIIIEPTGRRLDALVAYHILGWKWLEDNRSEQKIRIFRPPLPDGWGQPNCFVEVHEEWPSNREPNWDWCGLTKGPFGLPHYSTDDGAAWTVVKAMSQWMFDIKWGFVENLCIGQWQPLHINASAAGFLVNFGSSSALAETMPLAVCRAALIAKLSLRKLDKTKFVT